MRLNRGTLALLLLSVVVIALVVVINNSQSNQPEPTPTASTGGPLFPDMDDSLLVRALVRNNNSGEIMVLTKDTGGAFHIDEETTYRTDRAVDQVRGADVFVDLASLEATDSFIQDDLEPFGLAQPGYTLMLVASDGATYTLHVGDLNPTQNRYYVVTETSQGEAPLVPTAEPTSEITAEATGEATETAEATVEATEEAEVASEEEEATAEATDEAVVSTPEATEGATPEATEEGTEEATPEATRVVDVQLEGPLMVHLVQKTELDSLIALIAEPPYVPAPTETPTAFPTANPFSEVDQTATAAAEFTATMESIEATIQAMTATAEASVEATAEATEAP